MILTIALRALRFGLFGLQPAIPVWMQGVI